MPFTRKWFVKRIVRDSSPIYFVFSIHEKAILNIVASFSQSAFELNWESHWKYLSHKFYEWNNSLMICHSYFVIVKILGVASSKSWIFTKCVSMCDYFWPKCHTLSPADAYLWKIHSAMQVKNFQEQHFYAKCSISQLFLDNIFSLSNFRTSLNDANFRRKYRFFGNSCCKILVNSEQLFTCRPRISFNFARKQQKSDFERCQTIFMCQ